MFAIVELGVWSKDIVILFSDDGLAGTQAWLHSYHKHGRKGQIGRV